MRPVLYLHECTCNTRLLQSRSSYHNGYSLAAAGPRNRFPSGHVYNIRETFITVSAATVARERERPRRISELYSVTDLPSSRYNAFKSDFFLLFFFIRTPLQNIFPSMTSPLLQPEITYTVTERSTASSSSQRNRNRGKKNNKK